MSVLSSNLKNKVDLYGKVPFINELGENDFKDTYIKSLFVWILPATLTGITATQPTGTEYSNVQQRIKCRKRSIPSSIGTCGYHWHSRGRIHKVHRNKETGGHSANRSGQVQCRPCNGSYRVGHCGRVFSC